MLELTRDHVKKLTDEDLRSLIGRLCEEEAKSKGASTSCVTWGGNHTAPDGGLDVRVAASKFNIEDGYIPKSNAGFQVKKNVLTPNKVKDEM